MTDVAICIPHGGLVSPEFYRRLQTVQGQRLQDRFFYMEVDLAIVSKARTILTRESLSRTTAEVLWFVDDDVHLPSDAGVLIDNCLDLGVVSGLYFNRHSPFTPQIYRVADNVPDDDAGKYLHVHDYGEGLIQIDACGAGCLAVHRDVVNAMETYHNEKLEKNIERVSNFIEEDDEVGKAALQWLTRYVEKMSPWWEFLDKRGEDFYFCERAKDAGYQVWANVDVKCDHVGNVPIGEQHFNWLKENVGFVQVDGEGKPLQNLDQKKEEGK